MAYKRISPQPVIEGGTGATTLTGVVIGNGTSAFTASAVTQHDVLVGGASNAITSVAPSATSGVPLISQGASSDPAFGTAVVAGGGTGATSFTAYGVLTGGTTTTGAVQSLAALGASGTVLTSNGASALPSFQAAGSAGALTLISTKTASSSASIIFNSGITATYNNYMLVLSNFAPATNTSGLAMLISRDGGSTWGSNTAYFSDTHGILLSGTTWGTFAVGGGGQWVIIPPTSTTSPSSMTVYLYNATSASKPSMSGNFFYISSTGPTVGTGVTSGYYNAAFTVNAIFLGMASGNIATGTASLYGISQ